MAFVALVLLSAVLILSGPASLHASRPQLCLEGDFDAQVAQFINTVQLPKKELDKLPIVTKDLEQALSNKWPGSKVTPYGSTVAGLSMTLSDFDCYVALPNDTETPIIDILYQAKQEFKKVPEIFDFNYVKSEGAVPLVNLIHRPSGRECDVTFSGPIAIRDSELLNYYLSLDSRAYQLAMIVKYWSREHRLKETIHIPNFCITLLVIFYLQQLNIVPPLTALQKNAELYVVQDWNTGYNEIEHNSTNNDNMYQLLGGFFKYYSNFDFNKYVVSIYAGRPITKSAFRNWNTVPDEYEEYKYKVSNNIVDPIKTNVTIIVINPFDHQRNSARAVSPRGGRRLQNEFEHAAKLYKSCNSNRFLPVILTHHAYYYVKHNTLKNYCTDENRCIHLL